MDLIDTHCHLTERPLCESLAAVLDRAARAGVTRIVVPAYDPPSWPLVQALAAANPGTIYPALGLHPWVADQRLDLGDLANRLRDCRAVAIGEVGLDTRIESPDLLVQIPALEQQLELARDLGLPVILHCRGAFAELADVLERFSPRLQGVLHAFSRSPELARRFLRLGLHLGIGGSVTRPRARNTRATANTLPLERLLLETDAPSIGLEGIPPEAVEPRHVRDVAETVAHLRGVEPDRIADATTRNAAQLFGL
ncbi:MAG TPA: TatD family hydrolase [Candidatus Krumholzibacteria bacterium]|nr:TatD family hydrolase [Candidatus Krumholzibacteria bacterium]HPD70730.1 TatD family hydrolase [Candidatus Krumholzibacteria bacterium]HRY39570.1 TatD family hydrolase [Candidatus Krumholzibacteria bacterium]